MPATQVSRPLDEPVMQEIEHHYEAVGRILVYLVQRGLSRVDLDDEIALKIMPKRDDDEEAVLAVFADCLHWMNDENLIRVYKIHEFDGGYIFNAVQLTSLGVAVIQADAKDDQIAPSIQAVVKTAQGTPMDSGTYAKIGEFVGSMAGGLIKTLSG